MGSLKHITVRNIRQMEPSLLGEWVACEVENGYTVHCGDTVLYTVNSNKPRVFRSLDAVKTTLKLEIGVTEFKVEAMKM